MAAAAPPASPAAPPLRGVQPLRAGQGHSFFWRKLHSLSGIVPIGAFLVEHIVSNFEAINGPLAYAQQVKFLNGLPLVRVLEWAFIFIPLAFHAVYGVFIWLRGRSNVNVYPWAGNWMYLSQRVTGIIAFALHHPARLAAALLRRQPARASRRGLRQGPARARQPLDARHLRHRHDRHLLALRLRRLALRRQVGHHPRRQGPQDASATSAPSAAPPSASWDSSASTPSSAEVPERPRRRHARATRRRSLMPAPSHSCRQIQRTRSSQAQFSSIF